MWLGKLFGGRARSPEIDPGEEPARFIAPLPLDATATPIDSKRTLPTISSESASSKPAGFDPYNSGSFKKKDDAWVRVGRR